MWDSPNPHFPSLPTKSILNNITHMESCFILECRKEFPLDHHFNISLAPGSSFEIQLQCAVSITVCTG